MTSTPASRPSRHPRARMTSGQRREQLISVARRLFADNGVAGTSVEEIAATAGVSKPVVSYASILSDVASWAEGILADNFNRHGFDASFSPLYAPALTGMVGMAGQAWIDTREPAKEVVAAHLVDLAFNGLARVSENPRLTRHSEREEDQSSSS